MYRREVLAGSLPTALALAGCLGSDSPGENGRTPACRRVTPHAVTAARATPTDRQRRHLAPITFSEQPAAIRDVLRTAVEDGEYTVCLQATVPQSVERAMVTLEERIRDTLHSQAEAYPGDPPDWVARTAYLAYDDALYGLGYRESDVVVSTIAGISTMSPSPATGTGTTDGRAAANMD
mgnify:FL=1